MHRKEISARGSLDIAWIEGRGRGITKWLGVRLCPVCGLLIQHPDGERATSRRHDFNPAAVLCSLEHPGSI